MDRIDSTKRGFTRRDGLWLAAAMSLHASLLLIPVGAGRSIETSGAPLTIELQFRTPVEPPIVQERPDTLTQEPDLPEPLPESIPEALQEELPETADLEEIVSPPEAARSPTSELLRSTAALLWSAAEQNWLDKSEEQERILGRPVSRGLPDNWRSGIHLQTNRFDSMFAPRQIETLDRWVSADGASNVVITTPTGETLCGRGLAWDPMQPLVEHVMQFRLCGGGGKRTFAMPDRYLKNSEPYGIANSTTN